MSEFMEIIEWFDNTGVEQLDSGYLVVPIAHGISRFALMMPYFSVHHAAGLGKSMAAI